VKNTVRRTQLNIVKLLFKDKMETAIFLVAFFIELGFGVYLVYRWGASFVLGGFFGGDLIAQLHISRTVMDNGAYSGLQNLGTVWLPLSNLLRVPFVMFDVLYMTGLAGTIVNAIMTAGTCVLLYRFIGDRPLGVIAAALFLINVYTLALGASAFQMPTAVFFMVLSAYYFRNYWEKDSLTDFVKCSLAVIFATLSRYECWLVMASIIFLFVVRELKNRRIYRLAYVHLPLWGVFAWLFWNLAIFRDPFRWLRGGGSGYLVVASRVIAPQVERVLAYGLPGMFRLSGFLLGMLPILILLMFIRRDYRKFGVILVLVAPLILINLISWPGNERVLYAALPGIILVPLYVVRDSKLQTKIAIILLLLVTFGLAIPTQYNVFTEAVYTRPAIPSPYSEEMVSIEDAIGDGSYILTSASGALSPGRSLSVIYGISPSKIIDEYDWKLFTKVSKEPWLYSEYVIIGKNAYFLEILGIRNESDLKVFLEAEHSRYGNHFLYLYYYDPQWRDEFLSRYELILETAYFQVFKRVGG